MRQTGGHPDQENGRPVQRWPAALRDPIVMRKTSEEWRPRQENPQR
jgi:hypothetical protein